MISRQNKERADAKYNNDNEIRVGQSAKISLQSQKPMDQDPLYEQRISDSSVPDSFEKMEKNDKFLKSQGYSGSNQ